MIIFIGSRYKHTETRGFFISFILMVLGLVVGLPLLYTEKAPHVLATRQFFEIASAGHNKYSTHKSKCSWAKHKEWAMRQRCDGEWAQCPVVGDPHTSHKLYLPRNCTCDVKQQGSEAVDACIIAEAEKATYIQRNGPFATNGDDAWMLIGSFFSRTAFSGNHISAISVVAVSENGEPLFHPPIHPHHWHIHLDSLYGPSIYMVHGDGTCFRHDLGCQFLRFPDGTGIPIRDKALMLELTTNDVRIRHSRNIVHWLEVSVTLSSTRTTRTAYFLVPISNGAWADAIENGQRIPMKNHRHTAHWKEVQIPHAYRRCLQDGCAGDWPRICEDGDWSPKGTSIDLRWSQDLDIITREVRIDPSHNSPTGCVIRSSRMSSEPLVRITSLYWHTHAEFTEDIWLFRGAASDLGLNIHPPYRRQFPWQVIDTGSSHSALKAHLIRNAQNTSAASARVEHICSMASPNTRYEYVSTEGTTSQQWFSRRIDTCPDLFVSGGDVFTLVGFYNSMLDLPNQVVSQHGNLLGYAVL